MNPKNLKVNQAEIVCSLDFTLSVWHSEHGFFWCDKFDDAISEVFFKTENAAIEDCIHLIWSSSEVAHA